MVELSAGTPAERYAVRARRMRVVALSMGALGLAGLAAGFGVGFSSAAATDPNVRAAQYGILGGVLGVVVLSLGHGYGAHRANQRAVDELRDFADHCQK
jgi:hypothetical protein